MKPRSSHRVKADRPTPLEPGLHIHEMVRVKQSEVPLFQQQGTTCCYAKADKFWVRDSDGIPWEMYALLAGC